MTVTKAQVDGLSEPDFRVLVRDVMGRLIRDQGRAHFRIKPTSIASLAVGETRTFPFKSTRTGLGKRILNARRQLGKPDASWSYRTTNQGVRVTRIK